MGKDVSKAVAATVLNSLRGGVVPRIGLEYITVGRKAEISALLDDVDIIENGGATFRFLVGEYGSGKTFLMHVLRNHVCERGFVVSDVELSNERRLAGNSGQGLATYRELIRNLATQDRPDQGALPLILDKWMSRIQNYVVQTNGLMPDQKEFQMAVSRRIFDVIMVMSEQINGFAFGQILFQYYRAYTNGDEELKQKVLRWFYAEYKTKIDARTDLGVSFIITDENWYEFIKLFAKFIVQAGFKGLYICFDELPIIYGIPSKVGRDYNYSKLLSIYNDVLQGSTKYLGIMMSNTPNCMEDLRRGVFSHDALRTRICDGKYIQKGIKDLAAPMIHLEALNPTELYILIENITDMHALVHNEHPKLGHDDFVYFLKSEYLRMEEQSQITVRDIIRNYITLLNLIHQHPDKAMKDNLLTNEMYVL